MMNAQQFYEAGRLGEAIQAALAEVRSAPAAVSPRYALSVLLLFNGELEKAEGQLSILSSQHPERAVGVALLRQLIRAELCRQECRTAGRVPNFVAEPDETARLHLQALVCIRDGNRSEAVELLHKAESLRAPLAGACDGKPFDDLRDLDDVMAPFFEVLTSTGNYYWIPMSSAEELELAPPESLSDALWRPVRLTMQNCPAGAAYLPTLYLDSARDERESVRLGRATEWLGGDGTPTCGVGLRMFLVGDEARSIFDFQRLQFGASAGSGC